MDNNKRPMVSVIVTTYNHEKYISQTLDSILMQKVDFEYEIIVHDDASPDRTSRIIRRYEEKYPNVIKAIYQEENQYSKGESIQRFYIDYLRGKYIAICEGDDYWTDSEKLQKQVDFLENNSKYIATAHNVRVIDENYEEIDDRLHPYKKFDRYIYKFEDAINYKLPSQLASLVYRNIWRELDDRIIDLYRDCKTNGDQKLAVLLTNFGDIYCFEDIMADHRKIVSQGTSWSARTYNKNMSYFIYNSILEINNFVDNAFEITAENKKLRKKVYTSALFKYIKKPTKENKKVVQEINKIKQESFLELYLYLIYRIIYWPLRKLKGN